LLHGILSLPLDQFTHDVPHSTATHQYTTHHDLLPVLLLPMCGWMWAKLNVILCPRTRTYSIFVLYVIWGSGIYCIGGIGPSAYSSTKRHKGPLGYQSNTPCCSTLINSSYELHARNDDDNAVQLIRM